MRARGLNHSPTPPSGEEPSKHMGNITAGGGGGEVDVMGGRQNFAESSALVMN